MTTLLIPLTSPTASTAPPLSSWVQRLQQLQLCLPAVAAILRNACACSPAAFMAMRTSHTHEAFTKPTMCQEGMEVVNNLYWIAFSQPASTCTA